MGKGMSAAAVGVVAIGRNEGDRLRRCLESVLGAGRVVVYVDSGSTDDSLEMARKLGAEVVELDLSIPFTAARARNAGWRHLRSAYPEIELVQFLDGDCELVPGWMETAQVALAGAESLVVVCGRRRERFPEATVYNQLCDIEWDTPIGEADSCGGDAMMKMSALVAVDGFDDTSIAGEEPELCFRLREKGLTIQRLDHEMTLHDANITRFRQWWQRSKRAGHAYAGNFRRHPEAGFRRGQIRSAYFWGLVLPLNIFWLGLLLHPGLLLGYLVYPLQVLRISGHLKNGGQVLSAKLRIFYAINCVASKFPHVAGLFDERKSHRAGRVELIEYK